MLLTSALIMAAIFICSQLEASAYFNGAALLNSSGAISPFSSLKQYDCSLHKRHGHRSNPQVKQGINVVSEDFKKTAPECYEWPGFADISVFFHQSACFLSRSLSVIGRPTIPILKTRK
jgi:hypothetical protein